MIPWWAWTLLGMAASVAVLIVLAVRSPLDTDLWPPDGLED